MDVEALHEYAFGERGLTFLAYQPSRRTWMIKGRPVEVVLLATFGEVLFPSLLLLFQGCPGTEFVLEQIRVVSSCEPLGFLPRQ